MRTEEELENLISEAIASLISENEQDIFEMIKNLVEHKKSDFLPVFTNRLTELYKQHGFTKQEERIIEEKLQDVNSTLNKNIMQHMFAYMASQFMKGKFNEEV